MPYCNGCTLNFSFQGYASHVSQTTQPACLAEFERRRALLPGIFDDSDTSADEDGDDRMSDEEGDTLAMGGPDGDEEDEEDDGQEVPFGGSFFDNAGEEGAEEGRTLDPNKELDDSDEEDANDDVEYVGMHGWEPPVQPVPQQPQPGAPVPAARADPPPAPAPAPLSAGRQHVEEALRRVVHVDGYPSARAGRPIGQGTAPFSQYDSAGVTSASNIYALFPSRMDWEVARWAKVLGPGSNALDRLLAIKGVSYLCKVQLCIMFTFFWI